LKHATARRAELRLVIGKLQEFAEGICNGLQKADTTTRQEVIRALVKQIEVGAEDVRIVYRVPPHPFVERPDRGVLQDCPRRRVPFLLLRYRMNFFVSGWRCRSRVSSSITSCCWWTVPGP
jgi:hypothetical protein